MSSLKSAVNATVTLGVLGLTVPASANVYLPFFPVKELHGSNGANTSSSFAASSLMAEKGFRNSYLGVVQDTAPVNWEPSIIGACKTATAAFGSTMWPSQCSPAGMMNALSAITGNSWDGFLFPNTAQGKNDALYDTVIGVLYNGSPIITPIFGQADHMVTVSQIFATPLAPDLSSISLDAVSLFDGGAVGSSDSTQHVFGGGLETFSGAAFASSFSPVVTAINPACDFKVGGCGAAPVYDPFFNQFMIMFEPPPGEHPHLTASFKKAPGIVAGGAMNAEKAQRRLWDALIAAGINQDPRTWNLLAGAVAGPASLVNGLFPDGSPWTYYNVPILRDANTAVGFAQLSADDGSFQHIQVFSSPVPFAPVSKAHAAQLVNRVLAQGDRLNSDGALSWNPLSDSQLARSPSAPYYEFAVTDANGKSTTARVMFHDGTSVRGRMHDGTVIHGQ